MAFPLPSVHYSPRPGGWTALPLVVLLAVLAPRVASANLFYKVEQALKVTDLDNSADQTVPLVVTGLNDSGRVAGFFTHQLANPQAATPTLLHAFVFDAVSQTPSDLSPDLGISSMALCVNHAGAVAGVYWTNGASVQQNGFVWQDGVVTSFRSPEGGDIDAVVAINALGHVIGTYYSLASEYTRAFFWDGTTASDLGDLGDPSSSLVWPQSLNDSDQVAGTLYLIPADGEAVPRAFLWQAGVLSVIDGTEGLPWTSAQALDSSGEVVGCYREAAGKRGGLGALKGALWSEGYSIDLGSLGGGGTTPFSIDAAGKIVGTTYDAGGLLHLFSWVGTLTDLGAAGLGGTDTGYQITGVGPQGSVTGFVTDANQLVQATVSLDGVQHRLSDLLPAYLAFSRASDQYGSQVLANSAGQIACAGTAPAGQQMALLFSPDPDTDNDGLPDSWEQQYFGQLGVDGNALAPSGSGLTILQAFQQGRDPHTDHPASPGGGSTDRQVVFPSLPAPQYAVLDLGTGYPQIVTNQAQVLIYDDPTSTNASGTFLWTGGQRNDVHVPAESHVSDMNNQGRMLFGLVRMQGSDGLDYYGSEIHPLLSGEKQIMKQGGHDTDFDNLYFGAGGSRIADDVTEPSAGPGQPPKVTPGTVYGGSVGYARFIEFQWEGFARGRNPTGRRANFTSGDDIADPYNVCGRAISQAQLPVGTPLPYDVMVTLGTGGTAVTYHSDFTFVDDNASKYVRNSWTYRYQGKDVAGLKYPERVLACAEVSGGGATLLCRDTLLGLGKLFAVQEKKFKDPQGNTSTTWVRKYLNLSGDGEGLNPRGEMLFYRDEARNGGLWRSGTLYGPGELLGANSPWSNLILTDLNDAGMMVGHATGSDGAAHALLLVPIEFSVKNLGSVLGYSTGWQQPSTLHSPTFEVVGKVPVIPGLNINIDIFQDVKTSRTVIFDDNSSTHCGSGVFLADDGYRDNPIIERRPVQFTTEGNKLVATFKDSPRTPLSLAARSHVIAVHFQADKVRDFFTVKVGDAPPQVVSEVNWSHSETAYFKVQPPLTYTVLSKEVAVSSPTINQTVYGRIPDDVMNDVRGDLSNIYGGEEAHWVSHDPQDSLGQTYHFPLDFNMQ